MGRSLVHMDDSGEDILLSNTLRNEVMMSVSTIITLSFLVLHPASATMRLISFL